MKTINDKAKEILRQKYEVIDFDKEVLGTNTLDLISQDKSVERIWVLRKK